MYLHSHTHLFCFVLYVKHTDFPFRAHKRRHTCTAINAIQTHTPEKLYCIHESIMPKIYSIRGKARSFCVKKTYNEILSVNRRCLTFLFSSAIQTSIHHLTHSTRPPTYPPTIIIIRKVFAKSYLSNTYSRSLFKLKQIIHRRSNSRAKIWLVGPQQPNQHHHYYNSSVIAFYIFANCI